MHYQIRHISLQRSITWIVFWQNKVCDFLYNIKTKSMASDSSIKNVERNTEYIIVSSYLATVCIAGFFLNAFALYKVRKVSNNNKKSRMILTNWYLDINKKMVSKINNYINKNNSRNPIQHRITFYKIS